jgi:superfamily II DNA or RNA helicase
MHLQIAQRLWVRPADLAPEHWTALTQWALQRYVLVNPAYWAAREHRRPCKHLPRELVLATLQQDPQGDVLELPRGAGRDLRRYLTAHWPEHAVVVQDQRSAPVAGPFDLAVTLRDYQQEAVDRVALQREGVVVAPTGSGKTVMAMGIIAKLGLKTLILVHTRTLLDQTCAAVQRCLGVQAGRIGGGEDRDGPVVVATVQSLIRRDPDTFRHQFGLVILDEAHHCPAATFTEVLQQLACRFRVGLTATPERADQLHPLLYATIGPELLRMKPKTMLQEGALVQAHVTPVETGFAGKVRKERSELITDLCTDLGRNQQLVAVITATAGQRALVLSDRVQHCEHLTTALVQSGLQAHLLIGKMTPEARQNALAAFLAADRAVLVATSSLVGEGFDCPNLDTLYLTVPTGNHTRTTQALGRILRPATDKGLARVYDFVDRKTPGMEQAFKRRLTIYRRHGAAVAEMLPVDQLLRP